MPNHLKRYMYMAFFTNPPEYPESKFRSPENNARYTRHLFFEQAVHGKEKVLYTLKRREHLGYPSLYQLYMDMEDITEWEFANAYFEDYDHWLMLCECEWFKPYIIAWREELRRKLVARGLKVVKAEAEGNGRNSLAAAKYLMERGWESKEEKQRLTKEAKELISKEAQKMASESQALDETMERIGLKVVK